MQEIPANNEQNMNTTTDLPIKKVWIVRDSDGNWDAYDNQVEAENALTDAIVENASDDSKEYTLNQEYGSISIGSYCYSAYDIAESEGITDEVYRELINDCWMNVINDYGETIENDDSDDFDIIVGMAIEEPNGDIHYIKDIDDYNGMSDPTELTDAEGNDWIITVHDDGTLTASRKPTTEYYLNIIVIKGGTAKVEELKCLGEDGFNKAIVECVKNGLTMCADTYRTDKVVKAFLLNTKEN